MGKSLKYVSEFTFPSDKGYSGSAGKTMVKAYARGGAADMKQDKATVKAAVHKHERAKHPGKPLTKMANGGMATNMGPGSGNAPPGGGRPIQPVRTDGGPTSGFRPPEIINVRPENNANPFANARPSTAPNKPNPFANTRMGSNTGQRYAPPPRQQTPPPQQPQGYEQFLAALSPQQRAQYDSARSQGLTPPSYAPTPAKNPIDMIIGLSAPRNGSMFGSPGSPGQPTQMLGSPGAPGPLGSPGSPEQRAQSGAALAQIRDKMMGPSASPSSVNTTTEEDMMGSRNRRNMGNPGMQPQGAPTQQSLMQRMMPSQPGYKKGGMVTKAPAAPAPKSDMLYSKKEVNAKNLLPGGKAPSLPRARGSVNMAKGGATCMAKGGKK